MPGLPDGTAAGAFARRKDDELGVFHLFDHCGTALRSSGYVCLRRPEKFTSSKDCSRREPFLEIGRSATALHSRHRAPLVSPASGAFLCLTDFPADRLEFSFY